MKNCLTCSGFIVKRRTEAYHKFRARKYCSIECAKAGRDSWPQDALTERPAMQMPECAHDYKQMPGDPWVEICSKCRAVKVKADGVVQRSERVGAHIDRGMHGKGLVLIKGS